MYREPRTFTVPDIPQHSAIIFCSRSALGTFLTWAMSVISNAFIGFATTENPVSSQFHVRIAVKVARYILQVLGLPRSPLLCLFHCCYH